MAVSISQISKGNECRDAIVSWVKKRLVGVEVLSSLEDLQRSKDRSEVFLVGYFDQDEVRPSVYVWNIAEKYRQVKSVLTN